MLSAAVKRVKRLLGSSTGESDDGPTDDRTGGPDLYECEGCGAVFISEPEECSNCETDEFSNVGSF